MLDETYKMYSELADNIPNWRTIDKNELINTYCDLADEGNTKADLYWSAIICRYWPKITRLYYDTQYSCNEEDVYDWLVGAILCAVNERSWRNPDKPLYNDPQGPDKIINRVLKTERINHLVHVNRYKRKANLGIASLDEYTENIGDSVDYQESDELLTDRSFDDIENKSMYEYLFNNKLYFLFFVYDIIINQTNSDSEGNFSENAVVKNLKAIDDQYISMLATATGFPYKDLLFAYSVSVSGRDSQYLHAGVKQALRKLREFYYKDMI